LHVADRPNGDDPDDAAAPDAAAPEAAAPDAAAPDEPRAGDVARAKSTADLEEKLDPATIAQLAAWFDLPSFAELEERRQAEDVPTDPVAARRQEVHARLAQEIDPTIVARMEVRKTAGDALIHLPPPMEIRLGGDIRTAKPEQNDYMGVIGDPRELDLPMWLEDVFREQTPQAILRDLHRPELDYQLWFEGMEHQPTLSELAAQVRAAIGAPLRITPDVQPAWRTIRDAFAELRHWKASSWAELPLPNREAEP
jgi:hypothetical protein